MTNKLKHYLWLGRGFSDDSDSKKSAFNAGDLGLIPGSGISHGEGNGYPLQYSCLRNPMDRGGWWVTVPGVTKSQTRLSLGSERGLGEEGPAPGLCPAPGLDKPLIQLFSDTGQTRCAPGPSLSDLYHLLVVETYRRCNPDIVTVNIKGRVTYPLTGTGGVSVNIL